MNINQLKLSISRIPIKCPTGSPSTPAVTLEAGVPVHTLVSLHRYTVLSLTDSSASDLAAGLQGRTLIVDYT